MTNPNKTLFEKICNREIPAHIVYEDDYFVAFLDIHPQAAGHILVIPRAPYRWVWDVPVTGPGNIGEYFTVVQYLAKTLQIAFQTDMIRSQIYGESVPHAHVWLWPENGTGDATEFEINAEKIRLALGQ
jgi:histidine triad (HIT) family protein